jgi:hypothetical protein
VALTVGTKVAAADRLGRDVHALKGARHRQSSWCMVHDVPNDLRQVGPGGRGSH